MVEESTDPVFLHNGGPIYDDSNLDEEPGWYFWDEIWTYYHGPFGSEQEARHILGEYCRTL